MTKIKKTCYCIILLIFLSTTYSSFAAFNDIGVGARPLGLGGAFVALADDSNAANYNAAGLAYIEENQIGATHAQRFSGLITYNTIGGIVPLGKAGAFGANIGILAEDSQIYREQTVRVSYGKTLFKQLGVGINLKFFGITFDETTEFVAENPYFARTSSSALSFDLGVIAKPFNSLSIGVSVENILPADISISENQTDSVPQNVRVGLAYNLASIAEMSAQGEAISNVLKATLGTIEVSARNGEISTRAGVEIWLNKAIAIRGGYGMNSGGNSATTFSLGGSAKIPISGTALQLDYGFQLLTGDLQDNTTQRFSVNLLF